LPIKQSQSRQELTELSLDGLAGLDFLWTPKFDSIWEPKVWLAAAGQIFFTLSIGMGSIQCYSSYVKKKDDVALNAMSAGWMNGFVEVVLGSSVIIPIAIGYFGIDGLKELLSEGGGLGLGFKTLPYLFEQWGGVLGVAAGVAWFGLLFFAGVTSSLAMGTPVMGFLQDEFGWKEKSSAWAFGAIVFVLGLPTVLFFGNGVFDEYDYWAGTVSLVIFAFVEIILFAWIFGIDRGWNEINYGADIKVPTIFKYVIKYVTPVLLGWVLINSIPGIWDTIQHKDSNGKIAYFNDVNAIEKRFAHQDSLLNLKDDFRAELLSNEFSDAEIDANKTLSVSTYFLIKKQRTTERLLSDPSFREQKVKEEEKTKLFKNMSRGLLLLVWLSIAYFVYVAYKKRVNNSKLSV
jgi:hypothetical protein